MTRLALHLVRIKAYVVDLITAMHTVVLFLTGLLILQLIVIAILVLGLCAQVNKQVFLFSYARRILKQPCKCTCIKCSWRDIPFCYKLR